MAIVSINTGDNSISSIDGKRLAKQTREAVSNTPAKGKYYTADEFAKIISDIDAGIDNSKHYAGSSDGVKLYQFKHRRKLPKEVRDARALQEALRIQNRGLYAEKQKQWLSQLPEKIANFQKQRAEAANNPLMRRGLNAYNAISKEYNKQQQEALSSDLTSRQALYNQVSLASVLDELADQGITPKDAALAFLAVSSRNGPLSDDAITPLYKRSSAVKGYNEGDVSPAKLRKLNAYIDAAEKKAARQLRSQQLAENRAKFQATMLDSMYSTYEGGTMPENWSQYNKRITRRNKHYVHTTGGYVPAEEFDGVDMESLPVRELRTPLGRKVKVIDYAPKNALKFVTSRVLADINALNPRKGTPGHLAMTDEGRNILAALGYSPEQIDSFVENYTNVDVDNMTEFGGWIDSTLEAKTLRTAEGVGHIAQIQYHSRRQLLAVTFQNGKTVVYIHVPASVGGQLLHDAKTKAVAYIQHTGHGDIPRHQLGVTFWDLVRIRGSRTDVQFEAYYREPLSDSELQEE